MTANRLRDRVLRRPAGARPVPHPAVPDARWARRGRTLLRALGRTDGGPDGVDEHLTAALDGAGHDRVWLALAVLSARLPTAEDVVAAVRESRLIGPEAVLSAARALATPRSVQREVEVVSGADLVDMGDLVLYPLGTGIQRVARSVGREWRDRHGTCAVAWTEDLDALRRLSDAERDWALSDGPEPETAHQAGPETVLVPWGGAYLLPELAIQPRRCAALQGLAQYSPTRCGVIGFDLVPVTSAETSAEGFAAVFALNLAAVAHFDVVSTISEAAATEYRGWRRMLGGAGLPGPRIEPVLLPAHAPAPSDQDLVEARDRFVIGGMPFVLCVGSHEPRKNHMAILQAAELLWRQGRRFSLTFVGGNSWGSDDFTRRLGELIALGRPVESVSRMDDRMLWAAYRVARCTVFPSLNEGFGLPVAESVSAGTPALASNFGSMREIAATGGVLLVDPHDDRAVAAGLDRLLTDDALHAELTAQAADAPQTNWAEYAEQVWRVLRDEE